MLTQIIVKKYSKSSNIVKYYYSYTYIIINVFISYDKFNVSLQYKSINFF